MVQAQYDEPFWAVIYCGITAVKAILFETVPERGGGRC